MKRSASPVALSPAARELLELGSVVEPPTPEQDERMDRALARLIAIDRTASPSAKRLGQRGAPAARGRRKRAPDAPGWRLRPALLGSGASKLLLALGALAATAGASFWVGRASVPDGVDPANATVPAAVPVRAALEVPAVVGLPMEVPARAPVDPPIQAPEANGAPLAAQALVLNVPVRGEGTNAGMAAGAARHAKRSSVSTETAPAPLGLGAEIQRLARAEAALRQGRAPQALAELEQPAAHLLEQAAALRAIAECTLDRAPGATRARETLRRWPASAFAPRIREACGL